LLRAGGASPFWFAWSIGFPSPARRDHAQQRE
jgi:hypothetical protein